MIRRLATLAILGCIVFWLLAEYIPALQSSLPTATWPQSWHGPLLGLGLVLGVVFVALQVWLVFATVRAVRRRPAGETGDASQPALNLLSEALWTILPVGLTALLLAGGYRIWLAIEMQSVR